MTTSRRSALALLVSLLALPAVAACGEDGRAFPDEPCAEYERFDIGDVDDVGDYPFSVQKLDRAGCLTMPGTAQSPNGGSSGGNNGGDNSGGSNAGGNPADGGSGSGPADAAATD